MFIIAKPIIFDCENPDGDSVEGNFTRFVTLYSCLFYASAPQRDRKESTYERTMLLCENSLFALRGDFYENAKLESGFNFPRN